MTYERALASLQSTGAVRVKGQPAPWSRATRALLRVLIGFECVLPVVLVVLLVVFWDEVGMGVGTLFGFIGVLVMVAGMLALTVFGYRRQGRFAGIERQDVTLEQGGLTLRGIGPIPWQDFAPAEYRSVRSEHGSNFVQRAVMPLMPSGLVMVNERTPQALRTRISPATGPIWNHQHLWIYVPGVEGMQQHEVMQLINVAHRMFVGEASASISD